VHSSCLVAGGGVQRSAIIRNGSSRGSLHVLAVNCRKPSESRSVSRNSRRLLNGGVAS
jgi:hypothetical protein